MHILLPILLLLSACSVQPAVEQGTQALKSTPAELVRVVDGDTIVVKMNNKEEHVRLIGIDATEKGECGSAEATAELTRLLSGQTITLQRSGIGDDRDKYGRLLRYVHTGSDDVGLLLLSGSYVHSFPWFDHERRGQYKQAKGDGVWGCL